MRARAAPFWCQQYRRNYLNNNSFNAHAVFAFNVETHRFPDPRVTVQDSLARCFHCGHLGTNVATRAQANYAARPTFNPRAYRPGHTTAIQAQTRLTRQPRQRQSQQTAHSRRSSAITASLFSNVVRLGRWLTETPRHDNDSRHSRGTDSRSSATRFATGNTNGITTGSDPIHGSVQNSTRQLGNWFSSSRNSLSSHKNRNS